MQASRAEIPDSYKCDLKQISPGEMQIMENLDQAFECEENDDVFMSCAAKGEYLNISMNDASEELARMEIGYSQILNLIGYLHRVRDSMIKTQNLPKHVRDNHFPAD